MVTIDPCIRLKVIQSQLLPAVLKSAVENTSSDIKTAIDLNLPSLEEKCYELAEKCQKKYPDCGKEIELCKPENIKTVFIQTREKLDKIWKEQDKQGKETAGTDL
ncbi:MAG: hypothetical protein C3F06_05680 [Candidatus Methanoperedenaceae archaeon]|nr:MAG: hypothetical protein C3F06_05680 [Candidatus Methanoperedenaceae archaeon]